MHLISYPSKITWLEIVTEHADSELRKNHRARMRSLLSKLSSTTITHTVSPLTEAALDWFLPLYNSKIGQKENPNIYNIFETTIGKKNPPNYFILTLFERNIPIGGTIFSERKDKLSIAYRIYPNDWTAQTVPLQANPALYSEYLINAHAWSHGYHLISHGRDRNPYGLNANIGLALFKLSIGCTPHVPASSYEVLSLDLDYVFQDIFVMEMPPDNNQRVERATLYASKETVDKYMPLTKYPDKVQVKVIERPTSIGQ